MTADLQSAATAIAMKKMEGRGTPLRLALRSWWKNWLGLVGMAMILLFVFVALAPGLVATQDPIAVDPDARLKPPGGEHFFGTDDLGRDVFSRVVYGTQLSLLSALVVVIGATVAGTSLGIIAGFYRGLVDETVTRLADLFISFPNLILAMAMVAVLGPGLTNAMLAIIFVWWPQYARLTRSQVLVLKRLVYVEAAHTVGASGFRILWRHLLPNCLPVVLVKSSLDIGYGVLITSGLSFLGMGVRPPTPELGFMVTQGREFLLSAWWYCTFPGLMIFVIVLAFNLVGDTLRDILDPTLRS